MFNNIENRFHNSLLVVNPAYLTQITHYQPKSNRMSLKGKIIFF